MWITWLKTAAAGLLAFVALTGLAAVWHDRPYVYPAALRTGWLTVFVRATPRHVAVGAWRTADNDLNGGAQPYWSGPGLAVYTATLGRPEERAGTDAAFASQRHSVRIGDFGARWGGSPVAEWELLVPTWMAVSAGVIPLALVIVGRVRRGGRPVENVCSACRYDLRATPGRCPECGTERQPSLTA